MSKCISSHGEYSSHETDEHYVCKWCGAFDEAVVLKRLGAAEIERDEAHARIAEAAKLHRKYTYYDHEDSCPDTTDEHREEHHHESDEIGEFYCDQMPTGDVTCDNCRDVNGDRMEWPCPTAVSLGLNEGENDVS